MNVLAFFAHPDDETMLAGGILALLATLGVDVHIISATRGEGGDLGEPPYKREELGLVRSRELACAAEALGAASLTFLNYIDPEVGPDDVLYPFTDDEDRLAGELAEYIHQKSSDVLLTHGSNGEYGHPAHQVIFRAAKLAVGTLGIERPILWYTVQASFPGHSRPKLMNLDDPAHWVLDVRPVMEQKIAATRCHTTQNPLFLRRVREMLERPITIEEVALDIEGYHRVTPPFKGRLDDALTEILIPTGLLKLMGE